MIYTITEFIEKLTALNNKYPDYEIFIKKISNNQQEFINKCEVIGTEPNKEKKELYILIY